MRFRGLLLSGVALFGIFGCSDDPISREVAPELSAQVRWVNGVPDTVPMDYRFVTYPSNASQPNLAFTANSGNWRRIPAGEHRVRVFFTNTTAAGSAPDIVSQVFLDTAFALAQEKKYTILHFGFTKADATPRHRLLVINDDPLPEVPSGQIAFRVINAAPGLGTVNLFAALDTVARAEVSGNPIVSNLAVGAITPWINLPVATGANTYWLAVAPAGAATPRASLLAPAGSAAVAATATTGALDPIAGTRQAKSAMTIIIFGPRVAYTLTTPTGGKTTVAGSTDGAIGVLLDKHPARISP